MTHMTLQAVRQLIANDSYAITFQSIEQYRATLLRHFDNLAGDAVASQQVLGATEDHVLMPRRLTAKNGAKSLFLGEFSESIRVTCHECDGSGEDSEYDSGCVECGGDGTIEQKVAVEWDTIKRIYEMAVEHLAAPSAPVVAQQPPAQAKPLPAEPGWISVDERLPENGKDVIILHWPYDNHENERVANTAYHIDGVFYDEDGNNMHPPSHWMPFVIPQDAPSLASLQPSEAGEQKGGAA